MNVAFGHLNDESKAHRRKQIAMISPLFVIDFANAFKPCIGSKDKQVIRKPEANRTKRVS